MKIAFLCSSYEAGRDGVGDYVRQFVTNLIGMGHSCQVIALADRFAHEVTTTIDAATGVEAVRIPAANWAKGDIAAAEAALQRFAPDWVSLQMVCYGYDHRGLLMKSISHFKRLSTYGKRHLMLHELWIGDGAASSLKERCVGALQKHLLLRTARSWAPDVIHTSNPLYRELLRRNGIAAVELPLPGNIPIHAIDRESARLWLLNRLGLRGNDCFLAGVFGSIHPEWADTAWLDHLRHQLAGMNRRLVLVHIGRAGSQGESVWKGLQEQLRGRVDLYVLGELPATEVSIALQGLDLGVATTPWTLVGKSGTVAAMLEHGLPVLVTRDDLRLRREPTPPPTSNPLLFRIDSQFLGLLGREELHKHAPMPTSVSYADFLGSLGDARRHR